VLARADIEASKQAIKQASTQTRYLGIEADLSIALDKAGQVCVLLILQVVQRTGSTAMQHSYVDTLALAAWGTLTRQGIN
jgi:hypothetical protein